MSKYVLLLSKQILVLMSTELYSTQNNPQLGVQAFVVFRFDDRII